MVLDTRPMWNELHAGLAMKAKRRVALLAAGVVAVAAVPAVLLMVDREPVPSAGSSTAQAGREPEGISVFRAEAVAIRRLLGRAAR